MAWFCKNNQCGKIKENQESSHRLEWVRGSGRSGERRETPLALALLGRALSAFTDSKLQLQPGNEKAKMLTQEKTDEPNVHQIGNRRTHTGRVASEHTASSIEHREVRV